MGAFLSFLPLIMQELPKLLGAVKTIAGSNGDAATIQQAVTDIAPVLAKAGAVMQTSAPPSGLVINLAQPGTYSVTVTFSTATK